MPPYPARRTLRYARAWMNGPSAFAEEELVLDRDGAEVPATFLHPRNGRGPWPAWVVMHGITRPGRAHAQLVRFTRAVASTGIATIVPEVPEWRELRLAPHLSAPTVAAAIRGLRDTGLIRDQPVGLVGFSFGAPHAIADVGRPELRDEIGGVCGFGGYADVESTFQFMMSGHHRWQESRYHLRPDPYGRWIVAANYLPAVPGYQEARDVADALRALATEAGDVGQASWDPVYDPLIDRLRAGVAPERRAIFDLFARRSDAAPTELSSAELAHGLAEAARSIDPGIDPLPRLRDVRGPVHILHGRMDHLIPFTEAFRLREALNGAQTRVEITRLFGHSARDPVPWGVALRELPSFTRALGGVLDMV